jgi:hypothetical protein
LDLAAVRVMSAAWTRHPELLEDFIPTGERPAVQLAGVLKDPAKAALIRDGVAFKLGGLEDAGKQTRHDWLQNDLTALDRSGKEFAGLSTSQYISGGRELEREVSDWDSDRLAEDLRREIDEHARDTGWELGF